MVQDKQVTAAAVNSTAFHNYKNVLYKDADDICVLDSVGPLPPYAIVCNKALDGNNNAYLYIMLSESSTLLCFNIESKVIGYYHYWSATSAYWSSFI